MCSMICSQKPPTRKLRLSIKLLCVIGCSIHLATIVVDYFQYHTVALTSPFVPIYQDAPFVSMCFKLWNEVNRIEGANRASNVIKSCRWRNFTSNEMVTGESCSAGFSVAKFAWENSRDCITIEMIARSSNRTTCTSLDIASAIQEKNVIFAFSLSNHYLSRSKKFFILHFKRRPDYEFNYATHTNLGKQSTNVSFDLSYHLYQMIKLPPPYDTDCEDERVCLDRNGLRYDWCTRALCQYNFTVTHSEVRETNQEGVPFRIKSLSLPIMRVNYVASLHPESSLVEILGVLGLWTNLSVHLAAHIGVKIYRELIKRPKETRPASILGELTRVSRRAGINLNLLKCSVRRDKPRIRRKVLMIRFLSVIVRVVVYLTFLREIRGIANDYFEFKTRMDIDVITGTDSSYPAISHCFDYIEWLNLIKPAREHEDYDYRMTKFFSNSNFTLKQLFNSLPKNDTAIVKCRVRQTADSSPITRIGNCADYFTVDSFFQSEYLCYKFQPTDRHIDWRKIGTHTTFVYSIVVRSDVGRVSRSQSIIAYGYPSASRLLAREFLKQSEHDMISLSFRSYQYKRLPPPYDTRCRDLKEVNSCLINCMNLSTIDRAPYSELFQLPVEHRLVNYVDLKNETIASIVKDGEVKCKNFCLLPCEDFFTKTIASLERRISNETLTLVFLKAKFPLVRLRAEPVHTLYRFVFQLACCASFWLGFSLAYLITVLQESERKRKYKLVFLRELVKRMEREVTSRLVRRRRKFISSLMKCYSLVRSRTRRFLFLSALALGFCIHSLTITTIYFSYPTNMDTRLHHEFNLTDMRSTICIGIEQLDLEGNFSVQNIWNSSPIFNENMIECGYRGLKLPNLSHLPDMLRHRIMPFINSTSLCGKLFTVTKMITLGMVCYEVKIKQSLATRFDGKYNIFDSRIYKFILLSHNLTKYPLIVTVSQGRAGTSLLFPAVTDPTGESSHCKYYDVHHAKYLVSTLSYPYQIGVHDNLRRLRCVRRCVNALSRKLKSVSPYGEEEEPNEMMFQRNESSEQLLRLRCRNECSQSVSRGYSRQDYMTTSVDGPYDDLYYPYSYGSVGLWFNYSDQLVMSTRFYARLRLLDLVLYIGSLFTFWFGCSAIEVARWFTESSRKDFDILMMIDNINHSINTLVRNRHRARQRAPL